MHYYYFEKPSERCGDPVELAKIHADICSLYLSGAPLFTKETLRHISQQFKELDGNGGKVYVRGIDGTVVDFTVNPGYVSPSLPDSTDELVA